MKDIRFLFVLLILDLCFQGCGGGKSNSSPESNVASSYASISNSSLPSSNASSSSSSFRATIFPINPIPSSLWQPPSEVVPALGNYAYIEGSQYDPAFGAKLITHSNATIVIQKSWRALSVNIIGRVNAVGTFQAMNSLQKPELGFYENAENTHSVDPNASKMDWNLSSISCIDSKGSWFSIDKVQYDLNQNLESIEIRYESKLDMNRNVWEIRSLAEKSDGRNMTLRFHSYLHPHCLPIFG